MDRTLRAALLAAFVVFASVAGIGLFLQFEAGASTIIGAVAGVLAALLIWGAARRAESFHRDTSTTPVEPGFPGPPEPRRDPARDPDDRGHDPRKSDPGESDPGESEARDSDARDADDRDDGDGATPSGPNGDHR